MREWIGYCPEFQAGTNYQKRCYGDVRRVDLVMGQCENCGTFHSVADMTARRCAANLKRPAAGLTPPLRLVR